MEISYTLEPTATGWRAAALLGGNEVMSVQEGDFDRAAAWIKAHYKDAEFKERG